jgi:hypothetical protein
MSSEDEYVPTATFTCPPSSSVIENTFRMAQVLERKRDCDSAISKFLLVCTSIERVVALNPGSDVDIRFAILSLGRIANIYDDREDWSKSLAFRRCEQAFLTYLRDHQARADDGDIASVAATARAYLEIFRGVHAAAALPEHRPETPAEIARRYRAAIEQDRDNQTERVIRLLEESAEAKRVELSNSVWRRNVERVVNHPFAFVFCLLVVAGVVTAAVVTRPKRRIAVPEGTEAKFAFLERAAMGQTPAPAKRTATPRRRAEPEQPTDQRLFEI